MRLKSLTLILLIFSIVACKKSNDVSNLPVLTTNPITALTSNSANSGGSIIEDGGSPITARGVCWSTSQNPTINASKTTDGSGTGNFSSIISGLLPNTTYYVRAYATNSTGTAYGNQISFTTTETKIFVAGYEEFSIPSIYSIAKLWTNGQASNLTGSPNYAEAFSVYASGSDVFVAGYESSSTNNIAKLWKNGVATNITNGSNDAMLSSVFVSGGDVYVTGYESNGNYDVAKLWKNGVATTLAGGTNSDAYGYSIAVVGSDVYVLIQEHQNVNDVVKLWKNGVLTTISNTSVDAYAYSIKVSGNDVYIAGSQAVNGGYYAPILWKNGQGTFLSSINRTTDSEAYSVFVSGTDVYVAGYETDSGRDNARIWKNGVMSTLPTGTNSAAATSVFVSGSDVYAAGYENVNNKSAAVYWKNGTLTRLTDGTNYGHANSIFIK